jgi:hypothetical protein
LVRLILNVFFIHHLLSYVTNKYIIYHHLIVIIRHSMTHDHSIIPSFHDHSITLSLHHPLYLNHHHPLVLIHVLSIIIYHHPSSIALSSSLTLFSFIIAPLSNIIRCSIITCHYFIMAQTLLHHSIRIAPSEQLLVTIINQSLLYHESITTLSPIITLSPTITLSRCYYASVYNHHYHHPSIKISVVVIYHQ